MNVSLRFIAHVVALLKLLAQKLVVSLLLIALIIGFIAYMRGGVPTWDNILAVIGGYIGAFMVNFYMQFARYRDERPSLSSERAVTLADMVAALGEEYGDMLRRQASSGR